MSELRPTLNRHSKLPCMSDGTALLMVLQSTKRREGLIHGELKRNGEYCAIGCYFKDHSNTSLPEDLIDEVAAVNDSVPNYTPRKRKWFVQKWLRWKLEKLGIKGV
jgi:hypothetical protein